MMPDDPAVRLVVTRGLPGAGKTTRALTWLAGRPQHRARINRDVLREHVFATMPTLPGDGEHHVAVLQHRIVAELLQLGRSVVVDDTNLQDAVVEQWMQLARTLRVQFEVWDLRDIKVETCIERDAARAAAGGRLVGADVIRQIAARGAPTYATEPSDLADTTSVPEARR